MLNNVKKALGYRDIIYNVLQNKFYTYVVGDQFQELDIKTEGITLISEQERDVELFIENAGIGLIDKETLNSIPDANVYLLCHTPITDDPSIQEITSNPGENYYLYGYDGEVDEDFPYGAELIVKMNKEEAAICSLSPYFIAASGSIIQQATTRYPFLMADRRELDKLRAAVAAYYLSQAYDNATVLTKQAYWQDALNAAVSGSIVSTWQVLNDMKTALASDVAITEQFLSRAYANDPNNAVNIRYPGWQVTIPQCQAIYLGYNFNSSDGLDNTNGSFVFREPADWATFSSTYDTVSVIGPSGTYTWNLADALDWNPYYTSGKYIPLTSSAQIADLAAVDALIKEMYADTAAANSQIWTLRFESAAAGVNEDESVLDLVMQNMAGHIIKYPRYGVANPPSASTYARSFQF